MKLDAGRNLLNSLDTRSVFRRDIDAHNYSGRRGNLSLLTNTAWLLEGSERFTTENPGLKPFASFRLFHYSIKKRKI
jgi:hypothetical protein